MHTAVLLASWLIGASGAASMPNGDSQPTVVAAPPGAESIGVEWHSLRDPGVGTILLAVARPRGKGPFPAVVILHSTHGFAREYVELAKDLSSAGMIAVAACWFAPGGGQGMRFIYPLSCPDGAPSLSPHHSKQATQSIDAIMRAVRDLSGVQHDRVALIGHSRGAGASWNYVLKGGNARAVILNSSGYSDDLIELAATIGAPVLILHGEKDGPADGGSPMTDVRRARAFQDALAKAGKPVEAVYYPSGGHNGLFASQSQYQDEVKRMKLFLRQHLGRR